MGDREGQDNVICYGDREFVLDEPSVGVMLRILNVIGHVAVRAEGTASRLVKHPTNRAVLLGVLAELQEDDLVKLGSAVLQFEDEREGRDFIRGKKNSPGAGVKLAPIVKALMVNLQRSEDLTQAIGDFFGGVEALAGMLDRMLMGTALATAATAAPPAESPG